MHYLNSAHKNWIKTNPNKKLSYTFRKYILWINGWRNLYRLILSHVNILKKTICFTEYKNFFMYTVLYNYDCLLTKWTLFCLINGHEDMILTPMPHLVFKDFFYYYYWSSPSYDVTPYEEDCSQSNCGRCHLCNFFPYRSVFPQSNRDYLY